MVKYKGLRGTLERVIVSDTQVDRQIEQLIEQYPKIIPVTGRPSQPGDELVLDYAGYADGVQFEGGTAKRQTLTLGSGTFIPGFEEQLAGKNIGDEVDVHVTFPARYHAPHLAGKKAVFRCTIHEIRLKQKYAPDDAFARDVAGLDSFAALKHRVRETLQSRADQQAEEDLKAHLLDQLIGDDDVPEDQIEAAVEQQMQALEARLGQQGLSLDAYCRFTGRTRAQLRSDCLPDARKGLLRQRVIGEIAAAEGIEADEASVAEALRDICRQNNMTVEQLSAHLDEAAQSAIIQNVITGKVLDLIRKSAVVETIEKST